MKEVTFRTGKEQTYISPHWDRPIFIPWGTDLLASRDLSFIHRDFHKRMKMKVKYFHSLITQNLQLFTTSMGRGLEGIEWFFRCIIKQIIEEWHQLDLL